MVGVLQDISDVILEFLWKNVETPEKVDKSVRQNERKAHTAACYMAGLIARGTFISPRSGAKVIIILQRIIPQHLFFG